MQSKILKFTQDRNWLQFHTPRNLAESISIESAELLELFQWDKLPEASRVKEELADILIYAYQFCNISGWRVEEIMAQKLNQNEKKYPIEKFKGSNLKYDEYKP